jgi:PAS domain S-box-containing protein
VILPKISLAAPVPVYAHAESYLGDGIFGGKLLSAEVHGGSAARKALRILGGEAVSEIPVTVESSNRFMFDDRQRRRFKIPMKRIPAGAILFNTPDSFLKRHAIAIGWSLVAGVLFFVFFLILFFNLARRLRAEEQAAASERRYRLLADHSADVIWTMDAEHRLTYVSPAIEKLSGYPPEEFLNLSFDQWMTPGTLESARRRITERRERWDEVHRSEQEMIRKDGSIVFTEVLARGLRDEGGRPSGLVGSTRDITERRRAEAALRESERRYREIYERTPVMLHSIDTEGRLISVSDYWLKVMGYRRDEVLGSPSTDFLTEESRRLALAEYIPRFMDTGESWNVPYQFVKKSGEVMEVLMSAIAEIDAEGRFIRSLAVLQDVTDQKRAEAALRESAERLRLVLEAGELGFWDWDIPSGVVRRNERWATMLGFSEDEIPKTVREWSDLIHSDDRNAALQSIQDHLDGKTALHTLEYRMRTKTGESRWIFDRARVVRRDGNGKPLRMCGTHLDITDRKRREEMDEQAARRRETTRRHQSLSTMAGAVAHNFNNLLMTILGNLDMALSDISRFDPARELITSARQSAMRAAGLSRLMLLYVGQGQDGNERFCLLEMIREQTPVLRELATDGVRISFPADREGEPCWIRGDRGRLAEALRNLVVNAVEAIGESAGEVAIRLERRFLMVEDLEDNYVSETPEAGWFVGLAVTDTGGGMSGETRRRLFEPYYTTKFTGRGLGLAVVLGIVRSHGGGIQVQSAEGAGSRIALFFPEAAPSENGGGGGNE